MRTEGRSELLRGQAQMPEVVPHLQEKEQVPMEDYNCPGIPWPGKAMGCQQPEGVLDNFLDGLPSGLRKVILTGTWS